MIENGYEVYDSEASEVEVGDFLYGLIRYLKPQLVVETGCYLGHTTKKLGDACWSNGNGKVVSFDVNLDFVASAKAICFGFPVEIILTESLSSMGIDRISRADLVFSDSASQQMRMEEFTHCKSGCTFVVHDTWGHGAEHNKTLADWVKSQGGMLFNCGRGLGVIQK